MLNALIPKAGGGAGPGAGGRIPGADFKQEILVTGFGTACCAEPPRVLGCHAAGGAVTKPHRPPSSKDGNTDSCPTWSGLSWGRVSEALLDMALGQGHRGRGQPLACPDSLAPTPPHPALLTLSAHMQGWGQGQWGGCERSLGRVGGRKRLIFRMEVC